MTVTLNDNLVRWSAAFLSGRRPSVSPHSVCMECKANENTCLFDLGEPCLGPITRGGCDSWCPNNRFGCWGCRGPAVDANVAQMQEIMKKNGFSEETMLDRLECFGGFAGHAAEMRKRIAKS